MRAFKAFLFKEYLELARNFKLVILGAVFLALGILNPFTAKITPALMDAMMPENMKIAIPEPTALDSWMQFYKNVPQMGFVVLVILFGGMMSNEFLKGTLVNMLAKGLPRKTVMLAKLTASLSAYTAAYTLCAGVTALYTAYYWDTSGVNNLVFSLFCVWLFGVFLLAAVLLGGTLFKSGYAGMLFVGGITAVLLMINILPDARKYNPVYLCGGYPLITGELVPSDFYLSAAIAGACIAVMVAAAVKLFDRKQITV